MTNKQIERILLMLEALRLEMRNQTAAILNGILIQNGGKADLEAQLGIAIAADDVAKRALRE